MSRSSLAAGLAVVILLGPVAILLLSCRPGPTPSTAIVPAHTTQPAVSSAAPTPVPTSSAAWRLESTSDHTAHTVIQGGRGVVAAFEPAFLITLPEASYEASVGSGWASVVSGVPERTLFAVRNPLAVTDPCSTGHLSADVAYKTIDAFTAYLGTLPGLTVESSPMVIGGYSAAELIVPSVQTADCASHRVYEWKAPRLSDQAAWFLNQGDTDIVYLVEYGRDIILLQWLGADVTTDEARALFATVRFDDKLQAR